MTIRLIDPDTSVAITAGTQRLGAAISESMARFATRMHTTVKELCVRLQAEAEQRHRDLDDELDWLGEWGGRRG